MIEFKTGAPWSFTIQRGPNTGEIRHYTVVPELHPRTGAEVPTGPWVKLERVDTGGIAWASQNWLSNSTGGWTAGHIGVQAVAA